MRGAGEAFDTAYHRDMRGRRGCESEREFVVESVAREIELHARRWHRRAHAEAWASVAIGTVLIPLIYLGLWFVCWALLRQFTHRQVGLAGAFSPVLLSVGGAWVLIGTVIAWRHLQPFEAPVPPLGKPYDRYVDPPPARIDRGELETSDPGSAISATSIAAVVATGPKLVIEGLMAMRDAPAADSTVVTRAAELLVQAASSDGLTERTFARDECTARAMALLWRLKLIRKDGSFVERWRIRPTTLGDEVARS